MRFTLALSLTLCAACAPSTALLCATDDDCVGGARCDVGACVLPIDPVQANDPALGEGEGEGEGEPKDRPSGEGEGEATFDNGYAVRLALTLDGARVSGDEALDDFPVLIDVTDDALRARAFGGALALPEGSVDVAMQTTAGEALPLDVELHDPHTGRLRAWVRVPQLVPNEDLALWLYAGRDDATPPPDEGVWPDEVIAVLHFEDAPSGSLLAESSGNSLAVARNLDADARTSAQVGSGVRLSDDNDAIELWVGEELEDASAVTLEAWARMDGAHALLGYQRLFHLGYASDNALELFVADASTLDFGLASFRVDYDGTEWSPVGWIDDFALGAWHHFVGVFDAEAGVQRLYVDGALVIESSFFGEVPEDHEVLHVGNWDSRYVGADSRSWIGVIDEVRVTTVARSAAWIETAHTSSRDPGGFVDVGAAERP